MLRRQIPLLRLIVLLQRVDAFQPQLRTTGAVDPHEPFQCLPSLRIGGVKADRISIGSGVQNSEFSLDQRQRHRCVSPSLDAQPLASIFVRSGGQKRLSRTIA
jgi:hypothetical protein